MEKSNIEVDFPISYKSIKFILLTKNQILLPSIKIKKLKKKKNTHTHTQIVKYLKVLNYSNTALCSQNVQYSFNWNNQLVFLSSIFFPLKKKIQFFFRGGGGWGVEKPSKFKQWFPQYQSKHSLCKKFSFRERERERELWMSSSSIQGLVKLQYTISSHSLTYCLFSVFQSLLSWII